MLGEIVEFNVEEIADQGANFCLPPMRRASATESFADQPPQEDRRVPRDETPDTRMEATDNIPMFVIPTMTTV
ncbi:hypothetical protein CEXT_738841 [Caerostris extrusa]|uniref:Uncharacterized protein n=1 Tax=Caerostris extrusa TaxID=172846 RepID=A0AAV4V4P2_CAEEX|nr:hypothetical protein CEXT_738841 [Caerostris extrusa]